MAYFKFYEGVTNVKKLSNVSFTSELVVPISITLILPVNNTDIIDVDSSSSISDSDSNSISNNLLDTLHPAEIEKLDKKPKFSKFKVADLRNLAHEHGLVENMDQANKIKKDENTIK